MDDDVRALLAAFDAQGVVPNDELGVLRARSVIEGVTALQGGRTPLAEVRELLLAGAGGQLPARLYRPAPAVVLPVVVYLHGGGWALGSVAAADRPCRDLAAASGWAVVSVEYRRAPETPFPGPLDDAVAAVADVVARAAELGVDPATVVVMGDSAGGNLAAAVALVARDRGAPPIHSQVLVYPCLLPTEGSPYPSVVAHATGCSLTRSELLWYWDLYLAGHVPGPDGYAAPLLAADLGGLAPAIVVTAGYDPLRDEGVDYVGRLAASGVAVDHLHLPGAIHGVLWMAEAVAAGRQVIHDLGERLRALARPG